MKMRGGFVSNSSTCSFLIVGVEVPWERMLQMQAEAGVPMPEGGWDAEDNDAMYDWVEGWRPAVGKHFDCDVQGYPESTQRVGVLIEGGDWGGIPDPAKAIAEASAKAEEIKARLGLTGEVKLYHGEYSTEEY